jgi:hypothetical protein
LHKVKFVRIRVILWSRKRKSYLNRDFLGGSFPLGSWRCDQGQAFSLVSSGTEENWVHCGISGHQLSQSWGFKSQSRNRIYCIINDCPGSRGRHCILQGVVKIMVSKRNVWSEEKDNYVTSEVGWKSGISSKQNECTGSLKMWSWNSFHQELKVEWAIVVGAKG